MRSADDTIAGWQCVICKGVFGPDEMNGARNLCHQCAALPVTGKAVYELDGKTFVRENDDPPSEMRRCLGCGEIYYVRDGVSTLDHNPEICGRDILRGALRGVRKLLHSCGSPGFGPNAHVWTGQEPHMRCDCGQWTWEEFERHRAEKAPTDPPRCPTSTRIGGPPVPDRPISRGALNRALKSNVARHEISGEAYRRLGEVLRG